MAARKPSPAVERLVYAIAVKTRRRVNWWCGITEAFALLSAEDRAAEAAVLEAARAAGLVTINPGPVAHSVLLTAAGLDLCERVDQSGGKRPG